MGRRSWSPAGVMVLCGCGTCGRRMRPWQLLSLQTATTSGELAACAAAWVSRCSDSMFGLFHHGGCVDLELSSLPCLLICCIQTATVKSGKAGCSPCPCGSRACNGCASVLPLTWAVWCRFWKHPGPDMTLSLVTGVGTAGVWPSATPTTTRSAACWPGTTTATSRCSTCARAR